MLLPQCLFTCIERTVGIDETPCAGSIKQGSLRRHQAVHAKAGGQGDYFLHLRNARPLVEAGGDGRVDRRAIERRDRDRHGQSDQRLVDGFKVRSAFDFGGLALGILP